MPFADDLVTIFQNDGIGTYGSTIFKSTKAAPPLVPLPSAVMIIVETGGTGPDRTHNDYQGPPAIIRPAAQLTVKAADAQTAEDMCRAAYRSAVRLQNLFINSGWYLSILPLQEPRDAGLDQRGNAQWQCNLMAKIGNRPW